MTEPERAVDAVALVVLAEQVGWMRSASARCSQRQLNHQSREGDE
jgi:hypothetical protein